MELELSQPEKINLYKSIDEITNFFEKNPNTNLCNDKIGMNNSVQKLKELFFKENMDTPSVPLGNYLNNFIQDNKSNPNFKIMNTFIDYCNSIKNNTIKEDLPKFFPNDEKLVGQIQNLLDITDTNKNKIMSAGMRPTGLQMPINSTTSLQQSPRIQATTQENNFYAILALHDSTYDCNKQNQILLYFENEDIEFNQNIEMLNNLYQTLETSLLNYCNNIIENEASKIFGKDDPVNKINMDAHIKNINEFLTKEFEKLGTNIKTKQQIKGNFYLTFFNYTTRKIEISNGKYPGNIQLDYLTGEIIDFEVVGLNKNIIFIFSNIICQRSVYEGMIDQRDLYNEQKKLKDKLNHLETYDYDGAIKEHQEKYDELMDTGSTDKNLIVNTSLLLKAAKESKERREEEIETTKEQMNEIFVNIPSDDEIQLINTFLSLKKEFDNIKWSYNKTKFDKFCNGQTGFPIVDACIRQLLKTGYMVNRGRMIVASFLTKDLHIDWRWGEQFFASHLVDYDPINNSQGWMWTTGNGTDAQPWFRIFNPWTQQKNYDYE
jgi:hypothetical protein